MWSKPIPLGWYFGAQWERAHGKNWPRALCDNWLKKDRYLQNFAAELPICPCKLGKALNLKLDLIGYQNIFINFFFAETFRTSSL